MESIEKINYDLITLENYALFSVLITGGVIKIVMSSVGAKHKFDICGDIISIPLLSFTLIDLDTVPPLCAWYFFISI